MTKKILHSPIEKFTRALFSSVIERLAVIVSEEDLSFTQVAALHIIDREKNVNVNDIAGRLSLSVSATSRMLEELVKKSLIERKEDQKNRRVKIITLSSLGVEFMNKLSIERVKIVESQRSELKDNLISNIFFRNKKGEEK
jgi:DNA-binding MarR family transcriptional regulator